MGSLRTISTKGEDGRRKGQLVSLRSTIENETGGAGYATEFNAGTQARKTLDQLVSAAGYTSGDNGTKYDYQGDSSGYVVIFPLKTNTTKYWCIDADGNSVQVNGLLATSAAKNCSNATRVVAGGGRKYCTGDNGTT